MLRACSLTLDFASSMERFPCAATEDLHRIMLVAAFGAPFVVNDLDAGRAMAFGNKRETDGDQ